MAGRGINKVILIGSVGAEPDVRHMPSGGAVANIRLATTEGWRDKQSGDLQERTEWHRVVFFNRLAEVVREHVKTGAKIYVEGSLRTRKWQDKNNVERYTTEIVAGDMQILSTRGSAPYPSSHTATQSMGSSASATMEGAAASANTPPMPDDDDIPF